MTVPQDGNGGSVVSVVIPTTGRDSLVGAVNSVLAQSFQNLELVIVNDSVNEVASFTDARIRVLATARPNSGGSAARQVGIVAAKGAIIALLDDDDHWAPDFLMTVLEQVRKRADEDMWIGTALGRLDDGTVFPARLHKASEGLLNYIFTLRPGSFAKGAIPTSSMVFPRRLGLEVPWRDSVKFHQDIDWLVDVVQKYPAINIRQVARPLIEYGDTPGSIVKRITPGMSVSWAEARLLSLPNGKRLYGDFLLTRQPFRASVLAGSWVSAVRTFASACRLGRPGPTALIWALVYALRAIKRRLSP